MSSKEYDFTGKVVLLTGSSSGIGAACARRFARSGAKVVITGYEEEDVKSMVLQIEKITGVKPLWKVCNLTAPEFAESLVKETIKEYGKLDVLINNAGWISPGDKFQNEHFMSEFEKIIELNLKCAEKMMHLCFPHLAKTRGCIVNTSSVSATKPNQGPSYCASKAAVNMLTECAALEMGEKGVRVNSVNPGPIRTSIGRYINKPTLFDDDCPETAQTILKRNGEPDEVANVFMFLASEEASYITGSHYVVDGGYLCH